MRRTWLAPAPQETLDFGNAGTGSRLMMGLVGGHAITARFDGDASLRKRRCGGSSIRSCSRARACWSKRRAAAADPVAGNRRTSAHRIQDPGRLGADQIGGAAGGLNSPGRTVVIEAEASRDHTEKMLLHFGANVVSEPYGENGRRITLEGRPELHASKVCVPADPPPPPFLSPRPWSWKARRLLSRA